MGTEHSLSTPFLLFIVRKGFPLLASQFLLLVCARPPFPAKVAETALPANADRTGRGSLVCTLRLFRFATAPSKLIAPRSRTDQYPHPGKFLLLVMGTPVTHAIGAPAD